MGDQGVRRVTQSKGDIGRGEDDDGDRVTGDVKKVQSDSPYFEKLKARLAAASRGNLGGGSQGALAQGDTLAELDRLEAEEQPDNPGFVVYGDDGHPIKVKP